MKFLPDYRAPCARRASVAAGLSPLLVLLGFTLIVVRLIDPDTGFAAFLACTVWVAYEMHAYQRAIDDYNATYVRAHLAWRSSDSLQAMIEADDADPATREFVQRFLRAGRALLRDGQMA
jgi:hypothetical protein